MKTATIFACLFLMGCADQRDDFPPLPPIPDPLRAPFAAATAACGGPWLEWSRRIETSKWPLRSVITITMRCLNDGRVVGPYSFEGLQ